MKDRAEYFRNRHQAKKMDPAYMSIRRNAGNRYYRVKKVRGVKHPIMALILGYRDIESENLGL